MPHKDPADKLAYQRAYRDKHREKTNRQERERRARMTPEQRAHFNRKNSIRGRFGISLEKYDEMVIAQNGLCAICRSPCTKNVRLSIDHDHSTDQARGLLCFFCNAGLGMFKDCEDFLLEAVEYLRQYRVS